ncbi:MAG: SDR family oxidoreductase [Rhodospirillaceae bacterium]|nr:MAG: SDR family oxidoreductase [Rhodospirillaceae bacterium]
MSRFTDHVVLVTGAASGIGLAAVRRFATEGACLYLADRDTGRLAEVSAGLAPVGRHRAVPFDATDETAWAMLADRIAGETGRLDVLVNNVGNVSMRSIADTTLTQWRETMAVNLDSVFLGTRAMLPLLKASGHGVIVNMSSIRGIVGGVNAASYCAAKGAVRLFTKATALECAALGNGVRANSLHPGLIETPLAAAFFADPEKAAKRIAEIPLGRIGQADEIADAILFLASDDSRYMTGAELVVDGGMAAQ